MAETAAILREIHSWIEEHSEEEYRRFQRKLIPTLAPEKIRGVRTPALRAYAKELRGRDDVGNFLAQLPHSDFEEDQLHAFVLAEEKDLTRCLEELDRFLPYINNWATCDQLSPKIFRKHPKELLEKIREWIASGETYVIRFGIGMLMQHYLEDAFDPRYLEWVADITSEDYYVNMMIAWYFATALAKQPEAALPLLEEQRLPVWVHNKTIQKAVESARISAEKKTYLKTLRVHGGRSKNE